MYAAAAWPAGYGCGAMGRGGFPARSFLELLLDQERDALLRAGPARRWGSGEMLVRAGDPAESATVLLSGSVKVHKTAAEGAEVVLALLGAGDLLGEMSAFPDAVRSADATALEPVHGVVVSVSALRRFLSSHPRATSALLEMALTRLRLSDLRRIEFATAGSLARVATRLVELAERFGVQRGDGAIEVALPLTQEELAAWSASSRESTARALHTLRELGLLETHRRKLIVRDLERLRPHAAQL
jgi:CRP/FNR family transcriptional regulator, cyclic AMP receptor protein